MRHRKAGVKLNRTSSHRNAMFRNMVTSLLKHDRIKTTDVKAKAIRGWADHIITLAKRGDLHARRQALSIVREKDVVHKLFEEAATRFGHINGGYTRIIKIGTRAGDAAAVSYIELVSTVERPKKKKKPKDTEVPKAAELAKAESKPAPSEGTKEEQVSEGEAEQQEQSLLLASDEQQVSSRPDTQEPAETDKTVTQENQGADENAPAESESADTDPNAQAGEQKDTK
jgi:large subunit ribosomal protein L17